jgi:hypothetical protein
MHDATTFLQRSLRYERLHADPRIACKTDFFAAATLVTRSLAHAIPTRFLGRLSALLERENWRRAQEILCGRLYETGRIELNTADFIRYEQALVQAQLDGLRRTDPRRYLREIHRANTQLALAQGPLARALLDCHFAARGQGDRGRSAGTRSARLDHGG